jgi:hypothetical protein
VKRHLPLPLAIGLPLGIAAAAVAWAALTPVAAENRDQVFEIPKGTWARRMAGDKVEILPTNVHLTLGVKDVLVLRNNDDVPQVFGPTLMMPGQSFRLPFAVASTYTFACTAHASGQLTVTVAPGPAPGWERLAWRMRALT